MIYNYFNIFEEVIVEFEEIISNQTVSKKIYNDTQGIISGEIQFIYDFRLSFMELIDTEYKTKLKYKYHLMDNNKEFIFRYDNAKHYPEIKTFPHHKHCEKGISESNEPDLYVILLEIQDLINLKK